MNESTDRRRTFGDIPSSQASWYRRRLLYRVGVSVNHGAGLLVSLAFLVIVGGALVREAMSLRDQDLEWLKRFMESAHQAREDDEFITTTSLVLSQLIGDHLLSSGDCPAGSAECDVARAVVDLTVDLMRVIDSEQQIDESTIQPFLARPYVTESSAAVIARTLQRYLPPKDVVVLSGPTACLLPGDTPNFEDIEERRLAMDLERAICLYWQGHLSALQVPEQAVVRASNSLAAQDRAAFDLRSATVPTSTSPSDRSESSFMTQRVHDAIRRSFALEAALRTYERTIRQLHGTECRRDDVHPQCTQETRTFTAAYFISVDSVLRIWRDNMDQPLDDMPTQRLWAATEYFLHYMKPSTKLDDEYVTRPYIDFAGAGIVQTFCRGASLPVAEGGRRTNKIAGVVCADLALREPVLADVVQRLDRGPLAEAYLLRFGPDCEFREGGAEDIPATLRTASDWRAVWTSRCKSDEAWRTVVPLPVGGKSWYFVPVGMAGDAHLVIALTPTSEAGIGRIWRWLILGAIGSLVLALLTLIAWQSRQISRAEREMARLRGLPAPAIETQPSGRREVIVFGNDRAEELLQVSIPRFGVRSRRGETRFWEIFDSHRLIAASPSGAPLPGRYTLDQIEADRRRGKTIAYYAKFTNKRIVYFADNDLTTADEPKHSIEWVRVISGPVVLPRRRKNKDAGGHLEATFGVIVPVLDDSLDSKLDELATAKSNSGGAHQSEPVFGG